MNHFWFRNIAKLASSSAGVREAVLTDKDGKPFKHLKEAPSKFSNLHPVGELKWICKELYTEAQNHKCQNLQTYTEHLERCIERVEEKKSNQDERLERSKEERLYRQEEVRKSAAFLLKQQKKSLEADETNTKPEKKDKKHKKKKTKNRDEDSDTQKKLDSLKRKFKDIQKEKKDRDTEVKREDKKAEPKVILTQKKRNYNVHYTSDVPNRTVQGAASKPAGDHRRDGDRDGAGQVDRSKERQRRQSFYARWKDF